MAIELYFFENGRALSIEDVIRLMTNLNDTVTAIKAVATENRRFLSQGEYDITSSQYRKRAYNYVLKVMPEGTGIIHVTPHIGGEKYLSIRNHEHTGEIFVDQSRENFTLMGQNGDGRTRLWAIVSYVS